MFLRFRSLGNKFKTVSTDTTSPEACRRVEIAACLPVLLDEDLQRLPVGQHHVRVYAEVAVALRILAAKIPDPQKNREGRVRNDYSIKR